MFCNHTALWQVGSFCPREESINCDRLALATPLWRAMEIIQFLQKNGWHRSDSASAILCPASKLWRFMRRKRLWTSLCRPTFPPPTSRTRNRSQLPMWPIDFASWSCEQGLGEHLRVENQPWNQSNWSMIRYWRSLNHDLSNSSEIIGDHQLRSSKIQLLINRQFTIEYEAAKSLVHSWFNNSWIYHLNLTILWPWGLAHYRPYRLLLNVQIFQIIGWSMLGYLFVDG